MTTRLPSLCSPRAWSLRRIRRRAFSLIEVTLALGIVTFALVGVVGVLPIAMNTSRQSYDKNRAAAIAATMFASFRGQPFQSVGYVDTQFNDDGTAKSGASGLLNLNVETTGNVVTCYATFLDVSTPAGDASDNYGQQRHLCFTAGSSQGGADYLVTMHFNNQPAGMAIMPVLGTVSAQANQIEIIISPVTRSADQYRFVSIVANRTN